MYATCLFCHGTLGGNPLVPTFPVGNRLAFDPTRGRLWVVCPGCERWNLAPLEERWEAVETAERLFRDARRRVHGDAVGLAVVPDGLTLVRIGTVRLPEFAGWRYGDQFGRRRRARLGAATGLAIAGGVAVTGLLGLAAVTAAVGGTAGLLHARQRIKHRRRGREVVTTHSRPDGRTLVVRGAHLDAAELLADPGADGGWRLRVAHGTGTETVTGAAATALLARIMPTINGTGGTQSLVDRAIRRLEGFTDPTDYLRSAAAASAHASRPGPEAAIARMPVDARLAVEMAVNEEHERCALAGELWLLEEAWREAEVVAAIADDLCTPAEVRRRLEALREATAPAGPHPPATTRARPLE